MPTYTFECGNEKCGERFEEILKMSESDTPQECPKCKSPAKKIIVAGDGGFILKGDGWTSKDFRIKRQMTEKSRRIAARTKGRPKPDRLVPNVGGEQVDSWSDAQRLAASKGKDATTYDPLVQKEQKGEP